MKTFTIKSFRNSHLKEKVHWKAANWALIFVFAVMLCSPPSGYAQKVDLPPPGTIVAASESFIPMTVKGIKVYPDNPLRFDFILDTGDAKLTEKELRQVSARLIKYFLASLTIPDNDLWVNLSPYEKDKIIPESFGKTEMGQDIMAQDYLLKQLTASLMYPEDETGKRFWDRVYDKAYRLYKTTKIPISTFNKVWIVPDKAAIYQTEDKAFVVESRLKVMLEEDYVAVSDNIDKGTIGKNSLEKKDIEHLSNISSQVVRDVLIPEIEKEINTGENFALLRQIYNSLVLATWFKKALKESLLSKIYVDQHKLKGVDSKDTAAKEKIYGRYMQAYKKGAYDYIKRDYDPHMGKVIPRRYFSGGFDSTKLPEISELRMSTIQKGDFILRKLQQMDSHQVDQGFDAVALQLSEQKVNVVMAEAGSVEMKGLQQAIAKLPAGTAKPTVLPVTDVMLSEGVSDAQFSDILENAMGTDRMEAFKTREQKVAVFTGLGMQGDQVSQLTDKFSQAGISPTFAALSATSTELAKVNLPTGQLLVGTKDSLVATRAVQMQTEIQEIPEMNIAQMDNMFSDSGNVYTISADFSPW
ncbi:MAG: hypothetical protein U9Q21_03405, partial [Candidatus Auribacterota bacterium]|nr:hypothetical protein [Candidatus Auribacterota bacterium]